jgi:DNA-binding response OmpR family regulator
MVVLAVGVDPSLLEDQSSAWKSAGYIVTSAWSVRDAFVYFRHGDFDLVLLGQSIPAESREKLTFLIRASGSRVPVVTVLNSPSACDSFADVTIKAEANGVVEAIGEIMANQARMSVAGPSSVRIAT